MSSEAQEMRSFAEQLYRNFIRPKVKDDLLSHSVDYFRAEVVGNPGNHTLTVKRPLDETSMTLPCTDAICGAAVGDQVVVFKLGSMSNAVVVGDGKLSMLGRSVYPVIGTQTEETGAWTGEIGLNALYDGLTIAYYLPYAGSGNATLTLTLADGTTTGAVPVYTTATTRATTQYGAGSTILLTYWSAGSISVSGTATTAARWTRADYNENTINTYRHYVYGQAFTAGSAGVKQYSLAMMDSDGKLQSLTTTSGTGTSKTRNTAGFRPGMIWYHNSGSNIASGSTLGSSTLYYSNSINARYSFNLPSPYLTAYKPVYLVGTISASDGLFYLASTWWAQELPASNDGNIYVYLGNMSTTYNLQLAPSHPAFAHNGTAWVRTLW